MTVMNNKFLLILQVIFFVIIIFNFLPLATAINAKVRAEVEGEGFHRTLKYHVDTGDFKNKSCHIAIFVELPSSLYANVDELADLRRLHKGPSCAEGEIDVELFGERAYYQNVTICSRLNNTKTILSIPIHQRYHFATSTGQPYNVTIPRPYLLIGCRDRLKEYRVSKIRVCWPCIEYSRKWRDLPFKWEGDGDFVWQIQVGNTSRRFEITCITLFSTLSGAAYILWEIYKSNRVPKDKRLKDN